MYMSKGKWNFLCVVESYQRKKYLSQLITLHVFTLSNKYIMSTYDFLLGDLLTIYVVSFAQRCIYSSIKFLIFRDCFLTMKMRNKKKIARS